MFRIFVLAILLFEVTILHTSSKAPKERIADELAAFTYEGHTDRIIYKEFIKEARRRLYKANPNRPPLEEKRIKEIIFHSEKAVYFVNIKIKESPWYTGHTVTVQEILEGVVTANMVQNVQAQQEWEDEPNIGYMDIRRITALNALWDLDIKVMRGHKVPQWSGKDGLDEYRADKEFQRWFRTILHMDLFVNFLTGTWTFCKVKNLAQGSFQKTVAFYTMGRKSYQRRLKKEPKSQGLAPVAWGHLKRWKEWHLVWKDVENRVKKQLKSELP